MIKISTYTRAYEACETFFAETGQLPTIDAIKPLIGINSPSTISSAIKAWKAALSTADLHLTSISTIINVRFQHLL